MELKITAAATPSVNFGVEATNPSLMAVLPLTHVSIYCLKKKKVTIEAEEGKSQKLLYHQRLVKSLEQWGR